MTSEVIRPETIQKKIDKDNIRYCNQLVEKFNTQVLELETLDENFSVRFHTSYKYNFPCLKEKITGAGYSVISEKAYPGEGYYEMKIRINK